MQGANAVFSLQTEIAIGERCVMAVASGTAVRLCSLPPPAPPTIKATESERDALEIQKALWDAFAANKAANGYENGAIQEQQVESAVVEVEAEVEEPPALELMADKDTCVLELDEAEDVETARLLSVRRNHMQVMTSSLYPARPPAMPHAFMQVWRTRLSPGCAAGLSAERLVSSALSGAAYKLRRLQPAALAPPVIRLDLPEDEIQLVVSGTAIPLRDPSTVSEEQEGSECITQDDDIFVLDEEQLVKSQAELVEDKGNAQPGGVCLTTLSCVDVDVDVGAGSGAGAG
ncbi:C2 domain-containing protein 5, partial [Leptidea sinapis]|uniref:C2 domain-containing protein 5 n=1 Tax=Leptidea sinapis TaxID=189913 RepID=UPI0021C2EE12